MRLVDHGVLRFDELAAAWHVSVEHVWHRSSVVLGFGRHDGRAVVLKVNAAEPHAGPVLEAFDGRGTVRVYAHAPDAVLVERAMPGHSLADVVRSDGDETATRVLAQVIGRMTPNAPPSGVPRVAEWGRAFAHYRASGDRQIPVPLAATAEQVYTRLAATQRRERLLHGDLHHDNVLFDSTRGWVAVDPKGVVGELEFEIGAALRNPWDAPSVFTDPATIRRRVASLVYALDLDESRVLGWAFAQAVLAAIWTIEDEGRLDSGRGCLALAEVLSANRRCTSGDGRHRI
jgi:streptomycin 6-kinase